MTASFQVDLRGIIEILGNHLYSSPSVFVRELLQNAVDATSARRLIEPDHAGKVVVEHHLSDEGCPQLIFIDDGVGLTEPDTHEFLATLGASSKRGGTMDRESETFIGRFGIGLLSCFLVSDEIVMVSRSVRDPSASAVEWRGRADGTYEVRLLEGEHPIGTSVYLSARRGYEEWFRAEKVEELLTLFGGLLPFPIEMRKSTSQPRTVNPEPPPWRLSMSAAAMKDACLGFGQRLLARTFFDAIVVDEPEAQIRGVLLVLPQAPQLKRGLQHRIYLRGMYLTDHCENLLPDWAFFVTGIIDAGTLRPTASRESLVEDTALTAAREALSRAIRSYVVRLEREDPAGFQRFLDIHERALKNLASEGGELLEVFARWLPFETSLGRMPLGDFVEAAGAIRYVRTVDAFRQIVPLAVAQGQAIVNAGYAFDEDLLLAVQGSDLGWAVSRVEAKELALTLDEPEPEREAPMLMEVLKDLLRGLKCDLILKSFEPAELPALYLASETARHLRAVEQTQARADSLYAGLIDATLTGPMRERVETPQLCLNAKNELVQALAEVDDPEVVRTLGQVLYLNALLMGRHPLGSQEMQLLTLGLQRLMYLALDRKGWIH